MLLGSWSVFLTETEDWTCVSLSFLLVAAAATPSSFNDEVRSLHAPHPPKSHNMQHRMASKQSNNSTHIVVDFAWRLTRKKGNITVAASHTRRSEIFSKSSTKIKKRKNYKRHKTSLIFLVVETTALKQHLSTVILSMEASLCMYDRPADWYNVIASVRALNLHSVWFCMVLKRWLII